MAKWPEISVRKTINIHKKLPLYGLGPNWWSIRYSNSTVLFLPPSLKYYRSEFRLEIFGSKVGRRFWFGQTWKCGEETHLASWLNKGVIIFENSECSITSKISSSSFRNITSFGEWVFGQYFNKPVTTTKKVLHFVTSITEVNKNLVLSKLDLFQEIEQRNRPIGDDIPKGIWSCEVGEALEEGKPEYLWFLNF